MTQFDLLLALAMLIPGIVSMIVTIVMIIYSDKEEEKIRRYYELNYRVPVDMRGGE